MEIEFDRDKDAGNRLKRGVSLALAQQMGLASAIVDADLRFNYGEARYQALGMISARLHVLVFTMRGDTVRAISLRKANARERSRYAQRS